MCVISCSQSTSWRPRTKQKRENKTSPYGNSKDRGAPQGMLWTMGGSSWDKGIEQKMFQGVQTTERVCFIVRGSFWRTEMRQERGKLWSHWQVMKRWVTIILYNQIIISSQFSWRFPGYSFDMLMSTIYISWQITTGVIMLTCNNVVLLIDLWVLEMSHLAEVKLKWSNQLIGIL